MSETKQCPFCAETILAAAIRCRFCQADLAAIAPVQAPAKQPAASAGAAWIGAALFAMFCFYKCYEVIKPTPITTSADSPTPSNAAEATPKKPADEQVTMAWVMAQNFVRKNLKSPGSADFGSVFKGDYQSPADRVVNLGPGRYSASGWVDSQNAFGTLVRTNFRVTMTRDPDGTWTAVDGPSFDN